MEVESHLLRIGALSFRLHTQVKFPWLEKTRKALGSLLERKWVGRKAKLCGFTSTDELFSTSHFLKGSGWTTKSRSSRIQF